MRQDLNQILVDQTLKGDNSLGWSKAKTALLKYDFPTFFTCLKSFYARLTYGAAESRVNEASYQRSLFILLTAGGLRVVSEDTQAQGRADLVADAFGRVFIFELKVGGRKGTKNRKEHKALLEGNRRFRRLEPIRGRLPPAGRTIGSLEVWKLGGLEEPQRFGPELSPPATM